jgi:hypothetical protein
MSEQQLRNLLRAELESLGRAVSSLQRSLAKCSALTPSPRQSFEAEESFDALKKRFAPGKRH